MHPRLQLAHPVSHQLRIIANQAKHPPAPLPLRLMTQFVLIKTVHPYSGLPEDLCFTELDPSDELLSAAALENLGGSDIAVWKVESTDGEADAIVDAARHAVLSGQPLENTSLYKLLFAATVNQDSRCLFWADDFFQLPVPSSVIELKTMLQEQLETTGNWEIYAAWRGDA